MINYFYLKNKNFIFNYDVIKKVYLIVFSVFYNIVNIFRIYLLL